MGETTAIEWTDHTHNHWIGCTKVSAACDHCYAEELANRWGWATWGAGEPRKLTSEANRKKPLAWNAKAERMGVRRKVFCNSLSDVFDNEVPNTWRHELMDLIRATPSLDWLLLTKRPQVARKFFQHQAIPQNVWMGTTVESNDMARARIPALVSIPATRRFLSCEPLLEELRLETSFLLELDWVIAGSESGCHARPSQIAWFRALRDQCATAGVYFFMKQIVEGHTKLPIDRWPVDLRVREVP